MNVVRKLGPKHVGWLALWTALAHVGCSGEPDVVVTPSPDGGADAPIEAAPDAPIEAAPDASTADANDAATTQLDFPTQPTTGYSAVVLGAVTVRVRDAGGQLVTTPTLVTLALDTGPGVLGGTVTATTSAGVATFSDLTISKSGSYKLVATALGQTGSSAVITVDAWQPWNGNLVGGTIRHVAVDPTDDKVAYVGTDNGGLYQTTDGTQWSRIAFAGSTVSALAIAPSDPKTIYAGNGSSGVYKSTDRGLTFAAANAGFADRSTAAIAVDPTNPQIVYSAPSQKGVQKSTNGGTSWTAANDPAFATLSMGALAIAPSKATTLYTQAYNTQVYKSIDGGTSWTAMSGLPANVVVRTIAVDPTNEAVVFVGLGESGGGIWKSTGGAFTKVGGSNVAAVSAVDLAIVTATPQTMYACAYGSDVWKSIDGGATWAPLADNLHGGNTMLAMGLAPSKPATIYVGHYVISGGGISKTTTSGASWADDSSGFTAFDVNGFAVDPASSSNVWLGGGYIGLEHSTDGGKTYTPISVQQGITWGGDFTVRYSGTTLYAGNNGGGLFKSTNGGTSFVRDAVLGNFNVHSVAPSAAATTIYVGGFGSGIGWTTNGGTNWTTQTAPAYPWIYVGGVAAHPTVAATAYAGLGDGLYRTTNSGTTWTKLSPTIYQAQVAFDSAAQIYAAGSTIQSSSDGTTWTDLTSGSPIDPNHPASYLGVYKVNGVDVVFLSGTNHGLWRRPQSTWSASGLSNMSVLSMSQDPTTPTTLYAGVKAGGLYRSLSAGE